MDTDKLTSIWEATNDLLESIDQFPEESLECTNGLNGMYEKLAEVMVAESQKSHKSDLTYNCNLLDKLMAQECLNCIIVNLYPGNEGYSIGVKLESGKEVETIHFPYEEYELLSYIDNEELPPMLLDLFEMSKVDLFYNGCIIAEIRDYRKTSNFSTYGATHVLLKPTTQSVITDLNILTREGNWSYENKLSLESELVLATSNPLCLDPSPAVTYALNRIQYNKKKLFTPVIERVVRRHTQPYLNRKRKLEQMPGPKEFSLHEYLVKKKDRKKSTPNPKAKSSGSKSWQEYLSDIDEPSSIKLDPLPQTALLTERDKLEYWHGDFHEEYIFEAERPQNKIYYCKLSIYLSRLYGEYIGELYVDRDYVKGKSTGSTCRFYLHSKHAVRQYIQQFTEILSEEGRKYLKITHLLNGQSQNVQEKGVPSQTEPSDNHEQPSNSNTAATAPPKDKLTNLLSNVILRNVVSNNPRLTTPTTSSALITALTVPTSKSPSALLASLQTPSLSSPMNQGNIGHQTATVNLNNNVQNASSANLVTTLLQNQNQGNPGNVSVTQQLFSKLLNNRPVALNTLLDSVRQNQGNTAGNTQIHLTPGTNLSNKLTQSLAIQLGKSHQLNSALNQQALKQTLAGKTVVTSSPITFNVGTLPSGKSTIINSVVQSQNIGNRRVSTGDGQYATTLAGIDRKVLGTENINNPQINMSVPGLSALLAGDGSNIITTQKQEPLNNVTPPPNVNIGNLGSMSNLNLQNLTATLTGLSNTSQGSGISSIAVPITISLNVPPGSGGILNNSGSVLVTSLSVTNLSDTLLSNSMAGAGNTNVNSVNSLGTLISAPASMRPVTPTTTTQTVVQPSTLVLGNINPQSLTAQLVNSNLKQGSRTNVNPTFSVVQMPSGQSSIHLISQVSRATPTLVSSQTEGVSSVAGASDGTSNTSILTLSGQQQLFLLQKQLQQRRGVSQATILTTKTARKQVLPSQSK